MGTKITKLRPMGGFSAEAAAACSIIGATVAGIPVSTTHTITGAIVGVGATKDFPPCAGALPETSSGHGFNNTYFRRRFCCHLSFYKILCR